MNEESTYIKDKTEKIVVVVFCVLVIASMLMNKISYAENAYQQKPSDLISSQHIAVAYSGFRTGQHPDRGYGAINPSDEEVLQDLRILVQHGFKLIRLYDSGENSATTLRLIKQHGFPIKVLLGVWLEAEISNHEGCPWLLEPIPADKLSANTIENRHELNRAIDLSNRYKELVVAVNVGNEALVQWNDHMVSLGTVIDYVIDMKEKIEQPVTVADNYEWWIKDGAPLAAVVDFIGVHTYPAWENKSIDQALSYTIKNIEDVHAALPNKPIAILEGGWATTANEFSSQANQQNQARYYKEVSKWAERTNTSFFFFEAFDEPWKGDPNNPNGAEKHWGLFFEDRTAKLVMQNNSH